MATQFTFSRTQDFPNQEVAVDALENEIRGSAITIALEAITLTEDDCVIDFKADLSTEEESLLGSIVAAHEGNELAAPTPALNSSGVTLVQFEPPEGRREEQFTIDFCDKTTWWHDTTRVEQETLVDAGDHVHYALTEPVCLVNPHHGGFFGSFDRISSHGVVVTVNDVLMTLTGPDTEGDFTVDFATGAVTFETANTPTDVVKMTYSRVNSSLCKIVPSSGKKLKNTYVEIQFSENIEMNDDVLFELWGLVDYFAPGYIGQNLGWGVIQSGDQIPLSHERYRTLFDFIVDAEKSYPIIPVFQAGVNNSNWRHYTQPIHIFRFNYRDRAVTELDSDVAMEIRVRLENGVPFGGEHAVATFYCKREDS